MHVVSLLKDAGPFGYFALLCGVPALLLALVGFGLAVARQLTGARLLLVGSLLLALATAGFGLAGRQLTLLSTERSVPNVPDDMQEQLLQKGHEEARSGLLLAVPLAGASVLLCLLGVAALLVRQGREDAPNTLMTVVLGVSLVVAAITGLGVYLLVRPFPVRSLSNDEWEVVRVSHHVDDGRWEACLALKVELPPDARVKREREWKGLSKRCYDAVHAQAPERLAELVHLTWFDEAAAKAP
jgi:hypothetical protein